MPAEIFAGENLMIETPLYVLAVGLTWKGPYNNATAYVIDDAVLGDDEIGYHCILASTGHAPPNATYWTALPAQPASAIKSIVLEVLKTGKAPVATWTYQREIQFLVGPLSVGTSYIIFHFVSGDDFTNVGAASNTEGIIFVATGTAPTTWTHGSILYRVTYPPTFVLSNGLFKAELLASSTVDMSGLYELRTRLQIDDTLYISSGAQTDVLCLDDVINVTPC